MRGLTVKQKTYLDLQQKAYLKKTNRPLRSIDRLGADAYQVVEPLNPFETIYQEVNMYLWDTTQQLRQRRL
jgi:hypothetical protein